MGIIFHRKPHGGRYDDPHGVTAPPPPPPSHKEKTKYNPPPPPTKRIKISSEPPAATKASRKAAKKSQKAIEKSGINDPAYREASAKRGVQYKAIKTQEDSRLDQNQRYKMDYEPTGIEKAYLKGGFEGVDEFQKPVTYTNGVPDI